MSLTFDNEAPIKIIAGPCQIESEKHAAYMAQSLAKICDLMGVDLIFKASYDKANRTSLHSPRGVGIEEGLPILSDIRKAFKVPVTTDVHSPDEAKRADKAKVDVLQIPAFLSRQTDLLVAAAETGRIVNIKKGQSMTPSQAIHALDKVEPFAPFMLTERGTTFGYDRLVVDMTNLAVMKEFSPVCFDATHSVQRFGTGPETYGARDFVEPLAMSAVAQGIAALFVEVHDDPDNAPSDGPNMLPLDDFPRFLSKIVDLDRHVKGY